MLKGGINVKVVSERLGHADIALMLNVYSHVLPNMQEEAARRIDGLLPRCCPRVPARTSGLLHA
jgi:integrase